VKVKAKNNKSGNAVIGIYKTGTGTLVWSYHIWVTDYMDGGTGKTVSMVNGHKFMDRNLGATAEGLTTAAYGLLYQWGRKDPFPGSASGSAGWNAVGSFSGLGSAAATSKTTNAAAIIDAIQNPMTFLRYYSSSNYDWLPVGIDNALWRASGGGKTIYDPCPAGWRVPIYKNNSGSLANSPWKDYDRDLSKPSDPDLTWASTGYIFTKNGTTAYYPAGGHRDTSSGASQTAGTWGYYFSATPDGEYATGLSFYQNIIFAFTTNLPRACGYSVRCMRE
jgi:hypothetical protein